MSWSAQALLSHDRGSPTTLGLSFLIAVAGLVIVFHGLILGAVAVISAKLSYSLIAGIVAFGLIVAFLWASVSIITRYGISRRLTFLCTIGLFVLIHGGWIALFDSYQVSDFGRYYQCGLEIISGTEVMCPPSVFRERALFVSVPAFIAFGHSLSSIQLLNLIITTATAVIVFHLAEKASNLAAGFVAVLILAMFPEYLYSTTLTSHDIHGIFWLGVYLLLSTILFTGLLKADLSRKELYGLVMASALSGASIFFAEKTRSYGPFCVVSAILFAVAASRASLKVAQLKRPSRRVLMAVVSLVILPLLVLVAANKAYSIFAPQDSDSQREVALLTATDTHTANIYPDLVMWYQHQFPLLPPEIRYDFALQKLVNEWGSSYTTSIQHLIRKNEVLSLGNGNMSFARGKSDMRAWDTSYGQVGLVNNTATTFQNTLVQLLNLSMYIILAARIVLSRTLPFAPSEIIVWSFSSVAYLTILVLLEVQPRYDIFLIFPFALAAGTLVTKFSAGALGAEEIWHWRKLLFKLPVALFLILALSIVAWLPLSVLVKQGFGMVDLRNATKMDPAELEYIYPGYETADVSLTSQFDRVKIDIRDSETGLNHAVGVVIPVANVPKNLRYVDLFVNRTTGRSVVPVQLSQICVDVDGVVSECRQPDSGISSFIRLEVPPRDLAPEATVTVFLFPVFASTGNNASIGAGQMSIEYLRLTQGDK